MNPQRAVRWAAASVAILVAISLAWLIIRFVPASISGKRLVDQATYVGTIVGCVGLLALVFQFMGSLRRSNDPGAVASKLRAKIGTDVNSRLGDMRRTDEDITLAYRVSGSGLAIGLGGIVDALLTSSGRVVLAGPPGVGKSYTALQVAAALIQRDPLIIPVVISLSRWTGAEDPTERLEHFLERELNVASSSADELLKAGRIFPILDGLDELCSEDTAVAPASELLAKLVSWRTRGVRVGFFLTSRRTIWDQIGNNLTDHHSLDVLTISAVDREEAYLYLARSLGGADELGLADELVASISRKGHVHVLRNPWQLSLMAEIVGNAQSQSGSIGTAYVERITDLANVESMIAYYVESSSGTGKRFFQRTRRARDYRALTKYANYLEKNRIQSRTLDGLKLSERDLVLHRLWPAAGERSPLVVDLVMCLILSAPGFYWADIFLWHRSVLARIVLIVFGLAWISLLVRTSTKPWVRAAAPNWNRLTDPRFFIRQFAAAVLIGASAWLIVGPIAASVCFVTSWLAIGLTVGFGQTLATDLEPRVVGPLGVLGRERQVSRFSAAVVFPVLAAGFSLTWGATFGIFTALIYCGVVGETVACALWRRYLAMIMASAFKLPLAPAKCLERMHALGHLRIAGTSYQFRHDDVLRYFARRDSLGGGKLGITAGSLSRFSKTA